MYSDYLSEVYTKNKELKNEPYLLQLEYLINNTADMVGSQTKIFQQLGVDTSCIIINAEKLQKKWQEENGIKESDKYKLVYKQVEAFQPDVLYISNLDFINNNWIKKVREEIPNIKFIIGSHCAPYNQANLLHFRSLDVLLTCTPGMDKNFKQNGINSYLLYHGFDQNLANYLDNTKREIDISFTGSVFLGGGYHDRRLKYIEAILRAGIDISVFANIESGSKNLIKQLFYKTNALSDKLKLAGLVNKIPVFRKYSHYYNKPIPSYSKRFLHSVQKPVFGKDMYQVIANSKISFNIHGDIANQCAGNVRMFEVTGLGACLITDYKNNINDLFIVDKEIVTYNSVDECIEKIKWLMDNEDKCQEIAKAGQLRTLKDHTLEKRCKQVINLINESVKI